jgi:hypothetical protein
MKGQILALTCEVPRVVSCIEAENRMVLSRVPRGMRMEGCHLIGTEFLEEGNKKVLEKDGNDGCAAVGKYMIPHYCFLTNG